MLPAPASAPAGYAGFGSFMGDNVEEMVSTSDDKYIPPPLPFEDDVGEEPPPQFGEAARSQFLVNFDKWTFVNHGAFGASARAPFDAAHRWRRHCEEQPLLHIDRLLFPHIVHSIRVLAAHVRARPVDLVLGQNATHLLNAVVFSTLLSAADAVFSLSIGYGSVKKMVKLAVERSGATHVEADVRFPATSADVVSLVRRTLPASTKLAIFDAITSNTAVALPIPELVSTVRAKCPQCRILVDAAHSLGTSAHLDVPSLNVDFWVSNCHKHLCSPRGCAVLWTSPGARVGLRPVVVSHGTGSGFTSDFIWDGCRDYAPSLVIPQTLRWWAAVGLDRAVTYMREMLVTGVAALLTRWQTHTLVPMSSSLSAPTMALVRLPVGSSPPEQMLDVETLLARRPPGDDGTASSADAKAMQDALFQRAVEVPVKCIQGRLYVRVSAHIYNTRDDYVRLGDAVAGIFAWP